MEVEMYSHVLCMSFIYHVAKHCQSEQPEHPFTKVCPRRKKKKKDNKKRKEKKRHKTPTSQWYQP